MSVRITVFNNNDHIRNQVVHLLRSEPLFQVVGEVSNLKDCVGNLVHSMPDIIIVDIMMDCILGSKTIKFLKEEFPHVEVLIYTDSVKDCDIYEGIFAGASGYILKQNLHCMLIKAVKELRNGGASMSPIVARRVLHMLQGRANVLSFGKPVCRYNLTRREKEILGELVNGCSYKMIGFSLGITYDTVRSHIKNIYDKLDVSSITEVVIKVMNENVLLGD
ncbi:MAG: response regulator transcription factor [Mucilaginibacter sp.]|uniref:response regulator transcription factor n=1 Tax=Mucilaginibacter sp. TaxID=1882438 RepID=UPI0031A461FF